MSKLIVLLIIAVICILGYFYYKNSSFKKMKEADDILLKDISDMKSKIIKELSRCEKICKNDETKELLKGWYAEYKEISKRLDIIFRLEDELAENINNYSVYKEKSEDLNKEADYIGGYVQQLYEKLKNYTDFELENTNMALKLKAQLKELNNLFDQKLKILTYYNDSFIESTSDVKTKIVEFENKQKYGDFLTARDFLESGSNIIATIEKSMNRLIIYYEVSYKVEKDITVLYEKSKKALELSMDQFAKRLEDKNTYFMDKKLESFEKIKNAKLLNFEEVDEIVNTIEDLNTDIESHLSKIELEFESIEFINKIREENKSKIKLIEELVVGSLEEKEVIKKLYSLNDIKQFEKIQKESNIFEKFKKDYTKLNELVKEENKNIINYKENYLQTRAFLDRCLTKVKSNIMDLKNIRSDELEIVEKLPLYKKEVIQLELYLRKYNHSEYLNRSLLSTFSEIKKKIEELEKELDKDTLDIGFLRITDRILVKLLNDFITNIQIDIKQRMGSEDLIVYYNRFVKSEERLKYSKHYTSLYNSNDFKQIIKEIHVAFKEMNPKAGEHLYKEVVNKIKIDAYKSVFN